ncbi:MAG: hypothetical protein J0H17_22255 [Rhizobiales bacterium]|nr:hypothetical protein [Hyphomicrobiales bacterium]
MKTHALAVSGSGPHLIVHDMENGRPKAGTFKKEQATLANSAAALMRLKVLVIKTAEQAAVAAKLPAGRLYSNGKGFVPFVRRDLYDQLSGLMPSGRRQMVRGCPGRSTVRATTRKDAAKSAEPKPKEGDSVDTGEVKGGFPANWEVIRPGHLVLAQESIADGWWEAIVTEREGDTLTLKWRDYPRYAPFKASVAAVALVNPKA